MYLDLDTGLVDSAEMVRSPNSDQREHCSAPEAIILHCISLPPGQYGGDQVCRLFTNTLSASEHPYFADIAHLRVSAHFLIQRDGRLLQFVATNERAWHAGESVCMGRPKVNDFSVGIELEGLDTDPDGFTESQYDCLSQLIACLRAAYPKISANNIFAHSDIAPGRKPDPGKYFDWDRMIN